MEVNYKDEAGKTQGKKLMSFTFPLVFNALKDAKQGDTFNITTSKNDKGYWDWTEATPATGGEVAVAGAKPASSVTASKGSYETADERTARQRLIVRQSSLTAALGTLTVGAKAIDKEAVKALAEEYTDWVFEKLGGVDAVVALPDDIPY